VTQRVTPAIYEHAWQVHYHSLRAQPRRPDIAVATHLRLSKHLMHLTQKHMRYECC
jgi:hypothetical protein